MSIKGLLRARSHLGTEKLSAMVNGKSVALVGNASSLFGKNQGAEIDAHDVVIRLNRGFIIDPVQQGSRTDIVGTARPLSVEQVEQYNPQLVYWLFWRLWRLPTWDDEIWAKTEIVPPRLWLEIDQMLAMRPTSGFVMATLLLKKNLAERVGIYGFDFYASPNFYRGDLLSKAHQPSEEQNVLTTLIAKSGRVKLN